jgi:hypothetical protein
MIHLLLGADGSLASAGVLLAASLEAVAADLEESGAGTACAISGSGSGGSDLDLKGLGIGAPGAGAGVALAAAAEAVGAALEEAGAGRADGRVSLALGDSRRADGLSLAAGIGLAASAETVRTALKETGAGRADSGIGVTLGVLGRADGSLARAGVELAAATEAVGADLEEACLGGTLSIGENSWVRSYLGLNGLVLPGLGLGMLVIGLGLGIGADTSGTSASISLAAATETIGAVLEEASARSTDSVVSALGVVVRADGLLRAAGIELATATEAIGADLEEACAGGTRFLGENSWVLSYLRLALIWSLGLRLSDRDRLAGLLHEVGTPLLVARIVGAISTETIVGADVELAYTLALIWSLGLTLSGRDRLAGLLHEVGTPLLVARIVGAPSTETIVGADVELTYTLALSLLGSRTCRSKASDSDESKDSGMHFWMFVDMGEKFKSWQCCLKNNKTIELADDWEEVKVCKEI